MYTKYFGLKEKPFNLTPDPKFLFLGRNHKESYAQLLYSVREQVGFVVLVGEVGTGKTTICRSFLNQLPDTCNLAFIFNPNLDDIELLKSLNKELGIEHRLATKKALQDVLYVYLLEQKQAGKRVILVIDEAQNLSPSVLEQVRLLSNLETETSKLIQIIMVGQPELGLILESESLRQLKQRVAVWCQLFPLDEAETLEYITHRLKSAGGGHLDVFTKGALQEIYRFTKGTPRLINILCDRALLAAYATGEKQITAKMVRKCIYEVTGRHVKSGWVGKATSALAASLAVAAIGALAASGAFSGVFPAEARQQSAAESIAGIKVQNAILDTATAQAAVQTSMNDAGMSPVPAASPTPPTPAPAPRHKALAAAEFGGPTALASAVERVFESWNDKVPLSQTEKALPLNELARSRGYNCFAAKLTLDQLRAFNYPALLEVSDQNGATGLMPLVALSGGEYRADTQGNLWADKEWLERHWTGKAYILWKDFDDTRDALLKKGVRGKSVSWLQKSLFTLGYISDKSHMSGVYGPRTERSVLHFQLDNMLPADGQAGEATRMIIYKLLPEYKTPRISLS